MFDIAWSELFVILIVALVVVGPKDLPKLMRKAGQWAGRARVVANQCRRSFDDMVRQSELEELRQKVNRLKGAATDPLGLGSSMQEIAAAKPKLDGPAVLPSAPAATSAAAPAVTATSARSAPAPNPPSHPDTL
jgi:sec-independent protein translocase protein TatB